MIKINLLPVREVKKREELRNHFIIVGIMALVVVIIIAYLKISISSSIKKVQRDIAQTRAEIQRLEKVIGEVNKIKQIKKELEDKLRVIDQLSSDRDYVVHLLDELAMAIPVDYARKIPRKIQLTSFEKKGNAVTIKGVSLDNDSVSVFVNNLEKSPYYQAVSIKKLTKKMRQRIRTYEFEVLATVEKPRGGGNP